VNTDGELFYTENREQSQSSTESFSVFSVALRELCVKRCDFATLQPCYSATFSIRVSPYPCPHFNSLNRYEKRKPEPLHTL